MQPFSASHSEFPITGPLLLWGSHVTAPGVIRERPSTLRDTHFGDPAYSRSSRSSTRWLDLLRVPSIITCSSTFYPLKHWVVPHGFGITRRQMQRSYLCCCSLLVPSSAHMQIFISFEHMDDCSTANHEELRQYFWTVPVYLKPSNWLSESLSPFYSINNIEKRKIVFANFKEPIATHKS